MKLDGTVKSAAQDGDELVLVITGWAAVDPDGTTARPLGQLRLPYKPSTRRAYHVGRRIVVNVAVK